MKILLVLFFCHFLADFTHLSTSCMLNAKRFGKPLLPILAHATVHASLMSAVICVIFGVSGIKLISLLAIQLLSHFVIDTLKGKINYWIPSVQSPSNKWHWVVFGADQYVHAVIILLMYHIILTMN